MWLQGELSETDAEQETVTIKLPEGTPNWNDSTVYLQRIHDALVAKGWGTHGPI